MSRFILFPFLFNQDDSKFEANNSCEVGIEDEDVVVVTFHPTNCQRLPPEPAEAVASSCTSSQEPMKAGPDNLGDGRRALAGVDIVTD